LKQKYFFIPEKLPHKITADIQEVLKQNPAVSKVWETLRLLAQNEWICWIGCGHRPGHPKKVYNAKKK